MGENTPNRPGEHRCVCPALGLSPGTESGDASSSARVKAYSERPKILGTGGNHLEGQRLQNAKSFAEMLKAPQQTCRLVSLLLLLALRWHQSNRQHLCLLPAQRPTLGLLRGAHPPAAAGSAAENGARSNSHCHRTPLPPPALSFFPSAPAEPGEASTLPFSTSAAQWWVVSQSVCPRSRSRSSRRYQGHKSMRLFPPRSS